MVYLSTKKVFDYFYVSMESKGGGVYFIGFVSENESFGPKLMCFFKIWLRKLYDIFCPTIKMCRNSLKIFSVWMILALFLVISRISIWELSGIVPWATLLSLCALSLAVVSALSLLGWWLGLLWSWCQLFSVLFLAVWCLSSLVSVWLALTHTMPLDQWAPEPLSQLRLMLAPLVALVTVFYLCWAWHSMGVRTQQPWLGPAWQSFLAGPRQRLLDLYDLCRPWGLSYVYFRCSNLHLHWPRLALALTRCYFWFWHWLVPWTVALGSLVLVQDLWPFWALAPWALLSFCARTLWHHYSQDILVNFGELQSYWILAPEQHGQVLGQLSDSLPVSSEVFVDTWLFTLRARSAVEQCETLSESLAARVVRVLAHLLRCGLGFYLCWLVLPLWSDSEPQR